MSQPLPPLPPLDMNIVAAQADAKRILSAIEQGQQPNAQLLENFQADLKRLENDPHVPKNVKHELLRDAKLKPEAFAKLGEEALTKLVGEVNGLKPNIPPGPVDFTIIEAQVAAATIQQATPPYTHAQLAAFISGIWNLMSDSNVPSALQQEIQAAVANPTAMNASTVLSLATQISQLSPIPSE